jgi:hypothetical protein
MMVDGMPVCEICEEFFTGPFETTLDGRTYHWSCLHVCYDCGREFQEGQPRTTNEQGYFIHESDEQCTPL